MFKDTAKIIEVVNGYFQMLYTADSTLADKLFFPEAHVQSQDKGFVVSINRDGFKQRMASRPIPRDRNEARDGTILHLDFAGPACAQVKLRSTMLDTLFIDYLTMLKTGDEWRIISKVFHAEPTLETTAHPTERV